MKCLKLQSFIVRDRPDRFAEAIRALTTPHQQGQMKWRYHGIEGLENADYAARRLRNGKNTGNALLKVAPLD